MKKYRFFLEDLISTLPRYTRTERNGIMLIILAVTLTLSILVVFPRRPLRLDYLAEVDRLNDSLRADYVRKNFSRNEFQGAQTASSNPASRTSRNSAKPAVYIELNAADSARLRAVRGIGPVISRNIVNYRSRLGGFVRKEQLKEVWGITDENFESISAQFFIDPAVIQKIDINFATANSLRSHPYFTASMVNRITEARQMKGGWNTFRELIDNDILLPDEAEKVAPYVVFTAP